MIGRGFLHGAPASTHPATLPPYEASAVGCTRDMGQRRLGGTPPWAPLQPELLYWNTPTAWCSSQMQLWPRLDMERPSV